MRFSAADMEILGQAPPVPDYPPYDALRCIDLPNGEVLRLVGGRQTGEMGFATVTDWEYYGGQRNPLDLNTPARTLDTSGTTVQKLKIG